MELKSMKKDPKSEGKENDCCMPESDEMYPYGLQIRLDTESITKLGIGIPVVGEKVKIMCEASVTSVSSREEQGGDIDQSVEYQITDMAVEPAGKKQPDLSKLYTSMS